MTDPTPTPNGPRPTPPGPPPPRDRLSPLWLALTLLLAVPWLIGALR